MVCLHYKSHRFLLTLRQCDASPEPIAFGVLKINWRETRRNSFFVENELNLQIWALFHSLFLQENQTGETGA